MYRLTAIELIKSNGRGKDTVDPGEEHDVNIYLGMMRKYIEMNTDKHHTDVITGYSKTQKKNESHGVQAPPKNMSDHKPVKAPKKS